MSTLATRQSRTVSHRQAERRQTLQCCCNDLAWWYNQTGGKIGKAFLVHGEPESLDALAPLLQPHVETPVIIPERLASYEV